MQQILEGPGYYMGMFPNTDTEHKARFGQQRSRVLNALFAFRL